MLGKQDQMKEDSINLKEDIFINISCTGQKIVEYNRSINGLGMIRLSCWKKHHY